MEYYFADGGEQRGPFALEQMTTVGLKAETLVWHEGLTEWMPASTFPELATALFGSQNPAAVVAPVVVQRVAPASALPYQTPITSGRNTNGMAIASLVLGIVGLSTMFCYGVGVIPGILAIIFGVLARKQISERDGQGRGMAKAGIICGSVAVALPVLGFMALVIFFMVAHH
jgi:hypothetical protein